MISCYYPVTFNGVFALCLLLCFGVVGFKDLNDYCVFVEIDTGVVHDVFD